MIEIHNSLFRFELIKLTDIPNDIPAILLEGDCREVLKNLDDNSIDSCVTDPPYEIGFMGKNWDATGIAYDIDMWSEVYRVLKPGAHLLAFSGSRTYHRMVCAIEDAGFEIRDQIMWLFGSGFPKGQNVSKAIEKTGNIEEAEKWDGWNTTLKPAHEPIVLARKPLDTKTVASNLINYGVGALNIDGCRVQTNEVITNHSRSSESAISKGIYGNSTSQETHQTKGQALGRWPANVIHDGSDEVLTEFEKYGERKSGGKVYSTCDSRTGQNGIYGHFDRVENKPFADTGSAARFFYSTKADKKDRAGSKHPTVKPLSLMRYLIRLITPVDGVVLDPFAGSGTTLQAAIEEGCVAIGCELEQQYIEDIKRRLSNLTKELT